MQRLQCRDCGHTFMDTDSLPGMKMPQELISLAFDMYYSNVKRNAIRRCLAKMYSDYPSDSTIYEWINKFTQQAIERTKEYKPEVGAVWILDETELIVGSRKTWCLDVIDTKTRYLLASHLSASLTQRDVKLVLNGAIKKAGKLPKVVVTNQLVNHIRGESWIFGKTTQYQAAKILTSDSVKQLMERFHATFLTRTRIIYGLKTVKAVNNLLQGWLVFYNYLRPQKNLRGKTPAQKAGINQLPKNWSIRKANFSG